MTHNDLVSIIIPVYNVAKYLDDCIKSILSQNYHNYEILLIDDGSTDNSGHKCDEYSKQYSCIHTYHKLNGGLSSARNYGINKAQGEYIVFVDSDDVIPPNAISALYNAIQKNHDGIACGTFGKIADDYTFNESLIKNKNFNSNTKITSKKWDLAVRDICYQRGNNNSVCGKIYHRKVWQGLRFREGILYEDLDIFYKLFKQAKRITFTKECVYLYRQREGSIIQKFSQKRLDVLDVTDRLLDWAKSESPELEKAARSRRLSAYCNIVGLLQNATQAEIPNGIKQQILHQCRTAITADAFKCLCNKLSPLKIKVAMTILLVARYKIFSYIIAQKYK